MATDKKKPLWKPQDPEESNISKFMQYTNKKHDLKLQTYDELHRWSASAATLPDFWRDAYMWLGLAPPGSQTVGPMLGSGEKNALSRQLFPPLRFFSSDGLNIAEILFRDRLDDEVAIHFAREGHDGAEKINWRQLRERTAKIRGALIGSGVVAGDVIAAVMSNSIDTFTIALATLSLGAVWASTSCDMGPEGIVDRYSQVKPKIIFADDGYAYAGKTFNLEQRIREWSGRLRSLSRNLSSVVVVPYCKLQTNLLHVSQGCTFNAFLDRHTGDDLSFAPVPFSHPAFILFSSGTTGSPKCIVHSTGGVALKVKTDMSLQHDVRRTDVVFQYTTTSWVMWVLNFISLSCASSMLLYDGSPFHPRPTILLELAQDVKISIFGTSPRYLSELKSLGIIPCKQFDLSALRAVTSTGAVLSSDIYHWFYSTAFPPKAQLISMTGGTDIAGCFLGGTPLLPVYAGEIQCKALGMAVSIFDAGRPDSVPIEDTGAPGELVCTQPFPSQPLAFMGSHGREKYRAAYFDSFGPNTWCQGDLVQRLTDTGGFVMLGRSDGVLNPSGVRFGSAEIYSVMAAIPEVSDSVCVGQRREIDIDERVLLFVKMKPDEKFTHDVKERIKTAIRSKCSPRHVPAFIFEVHDIPYTLNGKKCEINIKHIVNGRKVAVSGTIANPAALEEYQRYRDLPIGQKQTEIVFTKL
ncbi:hypothetical protein NW753_010178 [Fusarium oxysporum]|nr:hypothetical protein NW753_010178 [Fusarium oxysporum]